MNKTQISLVLALFLLPMSAVLLHLKVHPDITWLLPLALFDAFVITALYLSDKTRIYGFWLNTLIGLGGVIAHLQYSVVGTMADNAIMLSDIMIGYALLSILGTKKGRKK
ncbi:MAG: hypothetical protein KJ906_01310 [Nanoarchaeota archaeon]|nr:hypothetical protein [Nanoarchaeota archaeon]